MNTYKSATVTSKQLIQNTDTNQHSKILAFNELYNRFTH
jgi:hypothetical protein